MKLKLLIIVSLAIISLDNFAQMSGSYNYQKGNNQSDKSIQHARKARFINDSTVLIEVDVLQNCYADNFMAIFAIRQKADNLENLNRFINSRINGFKNGLINHGIDTADIYVDMISQVPVYDWSEEKRLFSKNYVEVPDGFELSKNVHIQFTNENLLDSVMLIAAQNEIYDLVKVDYFVDEIDKKYDNLRKKALEIAKGKKASFEGIGIDFSSAFATIAEEIQTIYPENQYIKYTASKSYVGKGKRYKKANKTATMFYSKIDYSTYEQVINPAILQPAIQLSYSLKIKYVLKKK